MPKNFEIYGWVNIKGVDYDNNKLAELVDKPIKGWTRSWQRSGPGFSGCDFCLVVKDQEEKEVFYGRQALPQLLVRVKELQAEGGRVVDLPEAVMVPDNG